MEMFESRYVKVVSDTGWKRDNEKSRLDRGYALFYRIIECESAPNPAILNLIEKEVWSNKYPGNRDFKLELNGKTLKVTSVWDNSDD